MLTCVVEALTSVVKPVMFNVLAPVMAPPTYNVLVAVMALPKNDVPEMYELPWRAKVAEGEVVAMPTVPFCNTESPFVPATFIPPAKVEVAVVEVAVM